MTNIPIKIQFLKTLSNLKPHRIIVVKGDSDATFRLYITDKSGMPFPIEDLSGETVTIQNTDGNIDVTGTTNITLNISQNLLNTINSALQSGDNISELTNDAGYITTFVETDPVFQASEASLFEDGDKAKLDTAIQPNDLGAVATSNDYNDLDNLPYIPTADDFVPYVGATNNVDLGDNKLKANTLEISTSPTEGVDIGRIVWNPEDGTFDIGLLNDVVLQSGQEMYFYAKASEAISNGDAVQFNGSQGDHLLVKKAVPSEINLTPEYFMGVATQDFINNEFGYVTVFGKVRGLNTTAYVNPVLYFDSENVANGKLKDTIPQAPNAKIIVAAVVRNHITQGVLMVRPHILPKLESLQNVSNGSHNPITDNDTLLVKDNVSSVWKNLLFSNLKASIPDASETQRGLVNTNTTTAQQLGKGNKIIKGGATGYPFEVKDNNNVSCFSVDNLGNAFIKNGKRFGINGGVAGTEVSTTYISLIVNWLKKLTIYNSGKTVIGGDMSESSIGSRNIVLLGNYNSTGNGGTSENIFDVLGFETAGNFDRLSLMGVKNTGNSNTCFVRIAYKINELYPSEFRSITINKIGSVGVGKELTDPSAKLQIESITQGFLPPRMTQAQRLAIVSPAVGLHVYQTNTTEGVYVYKSTGWVFAY